MRVALAFLLLASTAMADNCHIVQKRAFVLDTGLTIVPFAVATPVAVVAPGSPMYSYRGPQTYQAAQPQVDPAEWAAFQAWKRQQGSVNALGESLVSQNCAACHTKDGEARDHFDLTQPLTADMKIAAAKALLSGSMPKGRTITDKDRGEILGELMGVEEASPAKEDQGRVKVEVIPPDEYDRMRAAQVAGVTKEDAIAFVDAIERNGGTVDDDPFIFAHRHLTAFWQWKRSLPRK